MGLKISELLKWRSPLVLNGHDGKPILDEKKKPVTVYVRVINDDDLEEAHRQARLASATLRKRLQDKDDSLYQDRIDPIMDASREDCIEVLTEYRTSNLPAEARAKVVKEELVTLEEVAIEPDAPTLEEQEKLDVELARQEERYQKAIDEYIADRKSVIVAELEQMDLEQLRLTATAEVAGLMALAEFFTRLVQEKVVRGTYTDKEYTKKAFDSIEDFIATDSVIKDQITEFYSTLEYDPDKIKK